MPETYEIHLDESGDFESLTREEHKDKQKKPIRLIGGIVVPESLKEKEEEIKAELMKIREKYFKENGHKQKRVTDIHLSDKKLNYEQQKALREKLRVFFNNKMPEAQIIFTYDLREIASQPLDIETPGAQLYRNMLIKLLKTITCYHPDFEKKDSFDCKLASRRFSYPVSFDINLPRQGYLKLKEESIWEEKKEEKNGDTNADRKNNDKNPRSPRKVTYYKTVYTAITEADLTAIMHQVKSSLQFKSDHNTRYRIQQYKKWDNPFMVMADFICNTIYNILKKPKNVNMASFHRELNETFNPKNGQKRFLFYCRSDYDLPESLLTSYHEGYPGKFLSDYLSSGKWKLYADNFLLEPALKESYENIKNTKDPKEIDTLITLSDIFLEDRLFHRFNDVYRIIKSIKNHMDTIAKNSVNPIWDPLAYRYHDVGLRYANHTANVSQGIVHRDKGVTIYGRIKEKEIMQIRKHHEFINRASICDTNEFAFRQAIDRLKPIKEKEEEILKLLGSGKNNEKNKILGKIYGSIAQNYAFLQNFKKAKNYFNLARQHLGENSMQASFRAHLAVDMDDKGAYLKELPLIFKNKTISLENCKSFCLNNLAESGFPLYIFLKGLRFFPSFNENKREDIIDITVKAIMLERKVKGRLTSHPWELIFILLGRHLKQLDRIDEARKFWKFSADFTTDKRQLTFIMIGHSARTREALSWLDEGNIDKAKSALKPIKKTFEDLKRGNIAPGIFNDKGKSGWFYDVGSEFINMDFADEHKLGSLCSDFIKKFTFNYR